MSAKGAGHVAKRHVEELTRFRTHFFVHVFLHVIFESQRAVVQDDLNHRGLEPQRRFEIRDVIADAAVAGESEDAALVTHRELRAEGGREGPAQRACRSQNLTPGLLLLQHRHRPGSHVASVGHEQVIAADVLIEEAHQMVGIEASLIQGIA